MIILDIEYTQGSLERYTKWNQKYLRKEGQNGLITSYESVFSVTPNEILE